MLKKIIENTIFVTLLIILGISVSPALPFKNIPRTYVVVSGSMEPVIKTGSIVLTTPVDPKTLKTGDIVAFTSPTNSKDVILHRISGIKSQSPLRFQTKGDNNNSPDAWDLMDVSILGQQVFAIPYIGHIAAYVRTPIGFSLIVVFPVFLFIISQILNIKKYIKDEIDKQVKSKTLPMLFFFLSFFSVSSLFFTSSALAKLSSTTTISGATFSTKDFVPPTTQIYIPSPNTNQNPFIISYTPNDSDIDYVELCYSFNDPDFLSPTCDTNFNFNFPDGEGTYYFYTQATDKAGNVEDPDINPINATTYDITPPTTNYILNTGVTTFSGQNLLSIGNTVELGVGPTDSVDILIQKILLPHNLSSNLTFSFKYFSQDIIEYSHLDVGVSTGTTTFNILSFGGLGAFDWQTISHSLLQWAGQTIDIYFKLTNLDPTNLTTTILKDISVSPLDLRTGDTTPAEFLATDLGSGIFDSTTTPEIISSTDLAGNIETTHSISVVTLPPVVLNKITSSKITLYNNTDSSVDLTDYSLDVGTTTILSGTIPAFGTRDFDISLNANKVILLNNLIEQDSTTFETLGSATWERQSNGLGPWVRLNAPVTVNLFSRLPQSKITMTISGLGETLSNMDYTINYSSNGLEQQIAGTIDPNTIDANGTVSRDFYLGTCSTGVCNSAAGIGSSFVVMFSTDPTPKIFNLN